MSHAIWSAETKVLASISYFKHYFPGIDSSHFICASAPPSMMFPWVLRVLDEVYSFTVSHLSTDP